MRELPKWHFRTGWYVCSRRSVHSFVAMRKHFNIARQTYNTTRSVVANSDKNTRRPCSKIIFNLNCQCEIKRVDSDSQQSQSVTMQDDPWNYQRCGSDKLWTPQLMLPVGANSRRRWCAIRPFLSPNNLDFEVIFSNPTNEMYNVHQYNWTVSVW
jgi:hypothetical protein